MPRISAFCGIVIYMYFGEPQHNVPHFHALCNGRKVAIAIENGAVLAGSLPPGKMKLLRTWAKIHRGELRRAWKMLQYHKKYRRIKPLR